MKKGSVLLALFFLTLICSAQRDFREGFVIKQPGDTLFGLINYRGGTRDYATCIFKESDNNETINYTPDDISGFGFPGDRLFVSKIVEPVSTNTTKTFIEVLVRGAVSLYTYNGRYFIQKEDAQLYELAVAKSEILKDGQKAIIVTKKYLGVLSMVLSDCEEARDMIPDVTLDERPLTKLAEAYNICVNSPYETILSGKSKIKFSFGLSAGLVNSHLDIFSRIRSDQVSYVDVPYGRSNSFQPRLSLDLSFPRFSERLSFTAEVSYFKSSFNSSTIYEYPGEINQEITVTIGLEQLTIPVGFRYTFLAGKISPYANLGFLNTINLKVRNDLKNKITQELYGDIITITNNVPALKEVHNQYGFWIGGGVMLPITKRIAGIVDLRTELSFGLTEMPDVATINNYCISAGLRFQ